MGKKLAGASRFWCYAIAVFFTNVRQLGVLVQRHPLTTAYRKYRIGITSDEKKGISLITTKPQSV